MRKITVTLALLLGCSSSTETNIPRDNPTTPAYKSQDAQAEVSDGQTQDAQNENSIDANRDSDTGGIGDTGSLDISVGAIDATEEPTEETQDANSEESEPDTNESTVDAGTADRAEEKDSEAEGGKDASPEAAHDASSETGADAKQETALEDSGLDCTRGCALQGRFACWPIREHPTFDVVVSDFIVKDRCTGLHWESHITSSSTYYTFDDAARACRSKALPVPKGVTAQWRMPTRLELASILDYSLGGPVLDTRTFAPSLDQFWTSSQTADTLSGWTLTMYQGATAIKAKTQNYYGRCVLDPLGDIYDDDTMWHFDQSTPGQFLDKGTLLTWEEGDSQNGAPRAFSSAQGYCQTMGWRLPTLKELFTLLDNEIVGAAGITVAVNSQVLPDALAGYYWTDTTVYDGGMTTRHWALHFGTGLTSGNETSAYVRCVK